MEENTKLTVRFIFEQSYDITFCAFGMFIVKIGL